MATVIGTSSSRPRPVRRPTTYLLWVAIQVALALLVAFYVVSDRADAAWQLELPVAASFVLGYPLVRRATRSALDPFEPLVPVTLMFGALFVLRPLWMAASHELIFHGVNLEATLNEAMFASLLGLIAFTLAYHIALGHDEMSVVPSQPGGIVSTRAKVVAAMYAATGLGAYGLHLRRSGDVGMALEVLRRGRSVRGVQLFGSSSEYLTAAPILLVCGALVIMAARRGRLRPSEWTIIGCLLAPPVTLFMLSGNRRFVIPSVAIPVVYWYLLRRRRPRGRSLLLVGATAFLILSVVPFVRSAGGRQEEGGFGRAVMTAATRPAMSMERVLGGPDTESLSTLASEMTKLRGPADYFLGRATLGDLVIAPIPSAIVPEKPSSARDEILRRTFGGPCLPVGGLCPIHSVVGTFFIDGWHFGVVVGMAGLGALTSRLWRRYVRSPNEATALSAATWTVMLPIVARTGFMPAFSWFLYFYVPARVGLSISWGHRK